jgi:hypothetical protein
VMLARGGGDIVVASRDQRHDADVVRTVGVG